MDNITNVDTVTIKNAAENFLISFLKTFSTTEYGKENGFGQIETSEEFKARHPVSGYSRFAPYIAREIASERNVFLPEGSVMMFATTSGTTGVPKLIPVPKSMLIATTQWVAQRQRALTTEFPKLEHGSTVQLYSACTPKHLSKTKDGTFVGPVTSVLPKHVFPQQSPYKFTSPLDAFKVQDAHKSNYIHAAFALADSNVTRINAVFITSVVPFLKIIQDLWRPLVNAVRSGELDMLGQGDIDKALAAEFFTHASVNRANELEKIFDDLEKRVRNGKSHKEVWSAFVVRLWPNLMVVDSCCSGAFKMYIKDVQWAVGDSVAFISQGMGSSEGIHGSCLDVRDPHNFTFNIANGFYELIEEKNWDEENPPTLNVWEAQVGKKYEYIVTNHSGLCRYRVGDVVEATGTGKLPTFQLLYRKGALLNVRGEKTSAEDIMNALESTLARFFPDISTGLLIEYTTALDLSSNPPRYKVFVELNESIVNTKRFPSIDELSAVMDKELCKTASCYEKHRDWLNLDRILLQCTKRGGFDVLRAALIQKGAATSQVKIPRKLPTDSLVQVIEAQCQKPIPIIITACTTWKSLPIDCPNTDAISGRSKRMISHPSSGAAA